MKKQNGITLIALVISIIVMLILAGVSINAIVGENGVLSRAQYSSFMNEMAAVEEAVQLWKAGELIESQGQTSTEIPANGLCNYTELQATERLVGEIGYYRLWSIGNVMPEISILSSAPTFNEQLENELVAYPAGVQDLYYLNNEVLELDEDKVYLIDAATSIVYSMTGISINGVRCYSTHMAKAVMGNNVAPLFGEAEVSGTSSGEKLAGNTEEEFLEDGTENPNYREYGFRIIADSTSDNIYKLYNNGELYGKGVKDFSFNYTAEERKTFDSRIWQEFTIPENIGSYKEIYQGCLNMFVIDSEGYLWAWGDNYANQLGLTQEQQIDYTGREAIKLNVDGKTVKRVFQTGNTGTTFVITDDNLLYAAGNNVNSQLGLGNTDTIYNFTRIQIKDLSGNEISAKNIYNMYQTSRYSVMWINTSNLEPYTDEWYNSSEFYIAGYNNTRTIFSWKTR